MVDVQFTVEICDYWAFYSRRYMLAATFEQSWKIKKKKALKIKDNILGVC